MHAIMITLRLCESQPYLPQAPHTMNYSYDSYEDYELPLTITARIHEQMDASELFELDCDEFDDSEYRDSRDDSARLADRHYC